jgi:hypothetical protein
MAQPTKTIAEIVAEAMALEKAQRAANQQVDPVTMGQKLQAIGRAAGYQRVDLVHIGADVEVVFVDPHGIFRFRWDGSEWKVLREPPSRDPARRLVTSFEVDENTAELLARLQKPFGVKTNAEVIRKALALANIASQHAGADNTITIAGDGQSPVKISLAE